jgi:hypothetical protein
MQVRVQIPAALKQKLLEDWDRVQTGSVASLPRRPSVNDILLHFVDACKSNKDLVEPEEEVSTAQPSSSSVDSALINVPCPILATLKCVDLYCLCVCAGRQWPQNLLRQSLETHAPLCARDGAS